MVSIHGCPLPFSWLQVEDFLAGEDIENLGSLRFWAGALKMIRIIERPIEVLAVTRVNGAWAEWLCWNMDDFSGMFIQWYFSLFWQYGNWQTVDQLVWFYGFWLIVHSLIIWYIQYLNIILTVVVGRRSDGRTKWNFGTWLAWSVLSSHDEGPSDDWRTIYCQSRCAQAKLRRLWI